MTNLYCFKHKITGFTGHPFALCEKHQKTYKPPVDCVIVLIGENVIYKCQICEYERRNDDVP